jgi:hypothetical protein
MYYGDKNIKVDWILETRKLSSKQPVVEGLLNMMVLLASFDIR